MRWPFARLGLAALLAFSASRASAAAPSAPGRGSVILLLPSDADDLASEVSARLRGELEAAGFEVVGAGERSPVAMVAVAVQRVAGGGALAEVRVSDPTGQKTLVARGFLGGGEHGRAAGILAVKSLELLKSSLAEPSDPPEVEFQPPPPAPGARAPPDRPTNPVRPPVAPPPDRAGFSRGLELALAGALVDGFGGVGAWWTPMFMAGYRWTSGLSVRASVAVFGQTVSLSTPDASARLDQHLATIDAILMGWPRAPIRPYVLAGLGAEHLHVVGVPGAAGGRGNTSEQVALLGTAGLGADVPVVLGMSLLTEIRALVGWPEDAIEIGGVEAGRAGGPSVVFDAGVAGVLR